MPQVSVIIPTHNRSEFLRSAIASVLSQTYQDFELIVVDDASTDTTAEVVASFNDERIKFIRHDANKGGSAARNTGIRASKCDYIAFLDDDDEWFADKLRKQMDLLLTSPPKVGGVYTGNITVDSVSGEEIGKHIPMKRGDLSRALRIDNCLGGTSSMLLKRACFEKVGLFDERLPRSQDYDLWLRISREFHFECVQEPLFKYHIHGKRISTNPKGLAEGLDLLAKKHYYQPVSKKFYSGEYVELGIMHYLDGNVHQGRRAFFTAIRLSPLQFRGYVNLLLNSCWDSTV